MKVYFKILIFLFLLVSNTQVLSQGKTTNPCLPAMSQAQRDSIVLPDEGTMLYNTTTGCINYYAKGDWKTFCQTTPNTIPQTAPVKNGPVKGTVTYDTVANKFNYYDGQQWIPFDQYAESVKSSFTVPIDELKSVRKVANKDEDGKNSSSNLLTDTTSASQPKNAEIETIQDIEDCSSMPTTANVGRDLVSTEDIQLTGNFPKHGKGKWLIMRGEGGVVADTNDPVSMFSGNRGTTYELRWEISTKCDTSYDDFLVRIRFPCEPEPSPSFAGNDQHLVVDCFLNAVKPKTGIGEWLIVTGLNGKVSEPNNPNSKLIGVPGETYMLRWIVRTKCGYTQDDVKISFKPPCKPKPSKANAGDDQFDLDSCQLQAVRPEFGQGKWKIIMGKGGRLGNSRVHNSTFEGQPEETYVLRWTVSTECGSTSDDVTIHFKKRCPRQITDSRDGQKYAVVQIENQCWLAENLNYRGVSYYCYDDFEDNCDRYGALYEWNEAMNNESKEKSQGACPSGWHIPSDQEWDTLLVSPGMTKDAIQLNGSSGFKMKYAGTRYPNGTYFNKKEYAFFWSSTSDKKRENAFNRYFHAESEDAAHYSTSIENAFSVRCVQD